MFRIQNVLARYGGGILRSASLLVGLLSTVGLAGCACMRPVQPAEGVAIEKVVDQIKQDLTKSSVANLIVGDGSVGACGDENRPLTLIRNPNTPPAVTLKLQAVRTVDITADAGVAKLPLIGILFSVDVSREFKRQETVEQDLTFNVVRGTNKDGTPVIEAVKPSEYSELGKAIDDAEISILKADHSLRPCLRPTKLSVSVVIDVTKTTTINETVGFKLLYSVAIKDVHSTEQKNQIVIDIVYSPKTGAALQAN